jgi:ELWxxDGT repeat protein
MTATAIERLEGRIQLAATLLGDLRQGPADSTPTSFTSAGRSVYFTAHSDDSLYVADGTTGRVRPIVRADGVQVRTQEFAVNGAILFTKGHFSGVETIRLGTGVAAELGARYAFPEHFTRFKNGVLYSATESSGREPYFSDGTIAGTRMLKNIAPGTDSSNPTGFFVLGDRAFFIASGSLWVTDGTAAGTKSLANSGSSHLDAEQSMVAFKGRLYFTSSDNNVQRDVWTSDGTVEGTYQLADLRPGYGGNVTSLCIWNRRLYFLAESTDSLSSHVLWSSDGTGAGTRIEVTGVDAIRLAATDSHIYLLDRGIGRPLTLWRYDADRSLNEISVPATFPNFPEVIAMSDRLYFLATSAATGTELWQVTGQDTQATLVEDLNPGAVDSQIGELTRIGNTLYFQATNGVSGVEPFAIQPPNATLIDRTLTIVGTRKADRVGIARKRTNYVVTLNGKTDVYPAAGFDRIVVSTGAAADLVIGNTVVKPMVASLGAGNDTMVSGDGADVIDSGEGEDAVTTSGGKDRVVGGAGNDVLSGGAGRDLLYGMDGNDVIQGDAHPDVLWGGRGNDILIGGSSDDTLYGDDGNDVLNGLGGVDRLVGGRGRDTAKRDTNDSARIAVEVLT